MEVGVRIDETRGGVYVTRPAGTALHHVMTPVDRNLAPLRGAAAEAHDIADEVHVRAGRRHVVNQDGTRNRVVAEVEVMEVLSLDWIHVSAWIEEVVLQQDVPRSRASVSLEMQIGGRAKTAVAGATFPEDRVANRDVVGAEDLETFNVLP